MELPIPPERKDLKAIALDILRKDPAALTASPHSGADPLAFVYGNRLPQFLWTEAGWGEALKARGVTLQDFLRVAGNLRRYFVKWVKEEVGWEDYLVALRQGALR